MSKRPNQKLTSGEVRYIRRRIAKGDSYGELGRRYDVHPTTIRDVITGRTYKWVIERQK